MPKRLGFFKGPIVGMAKTLGALNHSVIMQRSEQIIFKEFAGIKGVSSSLSTLLSV